MHVELATSSVVKHKSSWKYSFKYWWPVGQLISCSFFLCFNETLITWVNWVSFGLWFFVMWLIRLCLASISYLQSCKFRQECHQIRKAVSSKVLHWCAKRLESERTGEHLVFNSDGTRRALSSCLLLLLPGCKKLNTKLVWKDRGTSVYVVTVLSQVE